MKKPIIISFCIANILFFNCIQLIAQEKKSVQIETNLAIESVQKISVNGSTTVGQWVVGDPATRLPHIFNSTINIQLITNNPSLSMSIETSSGNGNLSNGLNELETKYKLAGVDVIAGKGNHKSTLVLDTDWKSAVQLRRMEYKIENGGVHSWNLFANIVADTSCSNGIYRDELQIAVMNGDGQKTIKKIVVIAKVAVLQNRAVGALGKVQQKSKDNADLQVNNITFGFENDVLYSTLEPLPSNSHGICSIPVTFFISQDKFPCTFMLESTNTRNFFADNRHHLTSTNYYLSEVETARNKIPQASWVNGTRLRTLMRRLIDGKDFSWQLWIKIDTKTKYDTDYTNTFIFTIIDNHGKRYSQTVRMVLHQQ